MDGEIQNMERNEVWDVVEKPDGIKVVISKWVFKLKRNEKGEIVKRKARLIARGFHLVAGIDFSEKKTTVP